MSECAAAIIAGNRRAASRLITRAEAGDETIIEDMKILYRAGGSAQILGITGPPGAGKSTLVDQLVALYRAKALRVGIVAVDPSSPFSGGAVLGDRVRMNRHSEDDAVFIRSMAARGVLGGLALAAGDAITILDAMRFDIIIVETVGIGQSEIDILSHAETVVLLQTAHGGDGIQTVKAGVLEIADILVVNKADAPDSDKMVGRLKSMVAHGERHDGWQIPVIGTQAHIGIAIDTLAAAVEAHRAFAKSNDDVRIKRKRRQIETRVLALSAAMLKRRMSHRDSPLLATQISEIIERNSDPYSLAESLSA